MRSRGGGQCAPPQPVAPAFIIELPAVAAGATQLSVRAAGIGDRAGAGIDQDAGPIPERRRQRDFGIAAHIDACGDARGRNRGGERLLLRRTPGAGRSDERETGGERDLGLGGRPARDVEDDRSRALRAAGSHRRARTVGAGEHAAPLVPDGDGCVRAAAVDAEKDGVGRLDCRTAGLCGHSANACCPTVRPSDGPTNEDSIPTNTVTAVPSGTYHGHASPGSQCSGKCGITAPRTTGAITMMLTMRAMMTSTWRARGQAPPRMYVPRSDP